MGNVLDFPVRSDKLRMQASVQESLASVQTAYQKIDIVLTHAFGKTLLLDNHVQLTELDEHAYHEALVQIPLLSLATPTRALVVGGGDGGVLRELCKLKELTHIDIVEIDHLVVETCRQYFPELSAGAFDDPRVHLHQGDAFDFVQSGLQPYDLIVLDATDVYEEGDGSLSEMLFTDRFYWDCARLLHPQGMAITQADNLLFCPYSLETIRGGFETAFSSVGSYLALVPSFGGFSGFCWASHGVQPAAKWDDLRSERVALRYLTPTTYRLAFEPLRFRQLAD